ncbi:MAG: DUF5668 domain-containing protein [Lachnospiraceae bacterium]|nr:DUF5668 domain-containing protein [Lachnospiraceae bacterium]
MENKEEKVSVHRVGTVTCGIILILYGALFLLHMVIPMIDYHFIFALWPVIFIILGLEILAGSISKKQASQKFVYDFPGILLVMMLAFFAMVMACVDYGASHGGFYYSI